MTRAVLDRPNPPKRIGPTYFANPVQEALRWLGRQALLKAFFAIPELPKVLTELDTMVAFLQVWHYLHRAQVPGDYLEFGVFRGQSFILALESARKVLKGQRGSRRFFAFDSFAGLPDVDPDKDSGIFQRGDFSAEEHRFRRNIAKPARGWPVVVVPGFFSESLTDGLRAQHQMTHAAFAVIDCDIYASTAEVLRFLAPLLHSGSVLYFDDWYYAGRDLRRGEPGACAEWLDRNPTIHLLPFGRVGETGQLFLVDCGETERAAPQEAVARMEGP